MRNASIDRKTKETDISVMLELDGNGRADISTGIGFFDHMLTAFAVHSGIDLTVRCKGDLEVDCHHTIEDVGIAIGQAFLEAVGDRSGIERYGSFILPMDEALALSAIDISGRAFLVFDASFTAPMIGQFDTQMFEEFWRAFAGHHKKQHQAIDDAPLRAQGSEPGMLVVDGAHILIPKFFVAHMLYLIW